jgi:PIN domain nuclease of toxin-antitoxin system
MTSMPHCPKKSWRSSKGNAGASFDRMIVAQSQMERLSVLTGDPLITQYTVERI